MTPEDALVAEPPAESPLSKAPSCAAEEGLGASADDPVARTPPNRAAEEGLGASADDPVARTPPNRAAEEGLDASRLGAPNGDAGRATPPRGVPQAEGGLGASLLGTPHGDARRASPSSGVGLLTRLLREPMALVDAVDAPGGPARHAPALLSVTAAGGALLGGVVGAHHGGVQVLYAAVKTPLLLLLPPLVALPAVAAAWPLLGAKAPWRRVSAAALVGIARTAVLAAALGPLVWLGTSAGLAYHTAVLVFTAALVVAGLPGLLTVLRALPTPRELPRLAVLGSLVVLGASFAQTGWLLRPFVARPTAEVSFLRPLEEDVFSSLGASQRSARGHYSGWDARSEGFLAPDVRRAPAEGSP